jgi:hypothetical protein
MDGNEIAGLATATPEPRKQAKEMESSKGSLLFFVAFAPSWQL